MNKFLIVFMGCVAVGALIWGLISTYKSLTVQNYKEMLIKGIVILILGALAYWVSFISFPGNETFRVGGFVAMIIGGEDVVACILKRKHLK